MVLNFNNNDLDYSEKRFYNAMIVGTILAVPVHFIAFLYYLSLDINVMAFLNFGGGLVFVYAFFLTKKSKFRLVYWLASSTVIFTTWFDTAYIGWNSGFHYYILLLLPVFFLYSKWTKLETFIAIFYVTLSIFLPIG